MKSLAIAHLPRDARDTLFHLLVVGWTILPHASNLPPWCIALASLVLLWRARLAVNNGALPSRWVVALALALACVLTLWSERTLLGKEAGVTMLVVLISLKTLELRARRDAMVMFFLGFFLVLTHFLYSQSLLVALSMLISVWGLLTALVLSHMPVGRPPLLRAGTIAARAALLGAPIMIALFVLFPRFGPLWGMPQDAGGRTGLSGSLRMGGIAELANDDSVALRVRFLGAVPPPEQRYFRGPVLSSFNGREWSRQQIAPEFSRPGMAYLQLTGKPLRYEMTLEASRLALLPLLEVTPQRLGAAPELENYIAQQRPDLEWTTDRPVTERIRFEASAWPQHRHGPPDFMPSLAPFLQLPDGHSPRTRAWAQAWRNAPERSGSDTPGLVRDLLKHIRQDSFSYTLEPGSYGGDAIDEFWLQRKLGFCEHFAASFVFIMRSLQIPARIVTGYQGTDPEPVDGYYVVRQSHAHAWAEVWHRGTGWVRVDPTTAVAPERINASRNLVLPQGLMAVALQNVDPLMAAQMRAAWEALNNRWNQYVLNYSRGQQFDLLRTLGVKAPNWQDLAYVLFLLLTATALAGAGWALWDRHRQDPWQRLQRRVQQTLSGLGVNVLPHHAPRARALAVRSQLGTAGEPLAATLDALDQSRYASPQSGKPDARWWRGFSAAAAHVKGHVKDRTGAPG